jgi:anti-anti-sigma factor
MGNLGCFPSRVAVELPDEIDIANAEAVRDDLLSACAPGVIIVADMTRTTFCDSRGTQELLGAHYRAREVGCHLRFVSVTGPVLRVWQIMGADRILAMYPTLDSAMSAT